MNGTMKGIVIGSVCSMLVLVAASAVAGTGVGAVFNLGQTNTVNKQSTLTGNAGVDPQLRVVNAGSGPSVRAESGSGIAIRGISNSGTAAFASSDGGTGVLGSHSATTGTSAGVEGDTASSSDGAAGVLGVLGTRTPGTAAAAVRGIAAAGVGVYGLSKGSIGSVPEIGVLGRTTTGAAMSGESKYGDGLFAKSSYGFGVFASSGDGTGIEADSGSGMGLNARNSSSKAPALLAQNFGTTRGIDGYSYAGTGVYGETVKGEAGYFDGNVTVANGYLKIKTIDAGPPPATDCDEASEAGRIVVRTDGPPNAYACTGSAWVAL